MEKIDLINTFVKIFLISFFIYFTYGRIINSKSNKINYVITFFISIGMTVVYIILNNYLPRLITEIILYTIYSIIINEFIENKNNYIAYIYSYIFTYAIYLISIVISGIILLPLLNRTEYRNPISLITIPIIFMLLFSFIFTRKRLKNGFNFLKNKEITKSVRNFAMFCIGVLIIFLAIFLKFSDAILKRSVFFGSIFIIISLVLWLKAQITKTYKNRMRDRTIDIQKTEIDEKDKIIEEIKTENLKLATAIHKYNKKLSSLEFAVKNVIEKGINTEFSNELSEILEEVKETSSEFAKETKINNNKLPLTNIVGIDNMFNYMQEEARKKDINFDLKINTSIHSLIEKVISKDKLETLIGDHLKDAIIAVDAKEATYKSILVTFGIVENCYEISFYDTGIEFEIETLLKLGKERVTTHKETGGSGIGFMTTFETLRECKASLIIEEYNPETTNYTKSVNIRFDGKNEYKINSFRAEKIKEQKPEHRIIIQELK